MTRRILLAPSVLIVALTGCARSAVTVVPASAPHVSVLDPLLAERIDQLAQRSPTFRAAWRLIGASGVPVRIGTDEELKHELPRWYREHPGKWAGVTVTTGGRKNIERVVVALRVNAMQQTARRAGAGRGYLLQEVDRVLVHEIYGHLTPVIEARDASRECPDAARAGELTPCVARREATIGAELASFRSGQRSPASQVAQR